MIQRANKTRNTYFSAFKAMKKFYLTQQNQREGINEYYSCFYNRKDLVQFFYDTFKLLKQEQTTNGANVTKESVLQKYLTVALVLNASKSKYKHSGIS